MTSSSATRSRSLSSLLRSLRAKASTSLSLRLSGVPVSESSAVPEVGSFSHPPTMSLEAGGWPSSANHTLLQPLLMGGEILPPGQKYSPSHQLSSWYIQGDVAASNGNTSHSEETQGISSSALMLEGYPTPTPSRASPSGSSSRKQRREAHVFEKVSIQTGDSARDIFIYADSPKGSIKSFESEMTDHSCEELQFITSQSQLSRPTFRSSLTLGEICLPSSTPSLPAPQLLSSSLSTQIMQRSTGPPARLLDALEELRCFHDECTLDSLLEEWEECDSPTEPFFNLGPQHCINQEIHGEAIGIAF